MNQQDKYVVCESTDYGCKVYNVVNTETGNRINYYPDYESAKEFAERQNNKKMKTYVITLSKVFPAGHSQAGKPTNFAHLLGNGLNISYEHLGHCKHKIHTIRANFQFWEKRIAEVQAGRAVLSVRRWKDKPYRSPQEEIERLTSADGVGIQKLTFGFCSAGNIDYPMIDNHYATEKYLKIHEVASNDGLSIEDFKEWFKGYDLSQPMAIIHFTKFRY